MLTLSGRCRKAAPGEWRSRAFKIGGFGTADYPFVTAGRSRLGRLRRGRAGPLRISALGPIDIDMAPRAIRCVKKKPYRTEAQSPGVQAVAADPERRSFWQC